MLDHIMYHIINYYIIKENVETILLRSNEGEISRHRYHTIIFSVSASKIRETHRTSKSHFFFMVTAGGLRDVQ